MRDFNSGILKQLLNVLTIEASMNQFENEMLLGCRFGHFRRFGRLRFRGLGNLEINDFACAALRLDLRPRRGAERMGADGQLPRKFTVTKYLDADQTAIRQAETAQSRF